VATWFTKRWRPYCWVMLGLAVVAGAYCILALVMVSSLSGAPNYPIERAQYNARIWMTGLASCVLIVLASIGILSRTRTNAR